MCPTFPSLFIYKAFLSSLKKCMRHPRCTLLSASVCRPSTRSQGKKSYSIYQIHLEKLGKGYTPYVWKEGYAP